MGKRMTGWWVTLAMGCGMASLAHAQTEPVALGEGAAGASIAATEPARAVLGEPTSPDTATPSTSDLARPGLLARWRKQLNRYTPRMAMDASTFSLGESLDTQTDGPLRFRPSGPALASKPDTRSLKSASDYADLRQMLRSRTLQWQPFSVGGWKFGASVGPVRTMTSLAGVDPSLYTVMPMASYQMQQMEWRVGMVPASEQTQTTLVVRLKLKAF